MIVFLVISSILIILLSYKFKLVREAVLISVVTIVLTIIAYRISQTSLFKIYVYPESFATGDYEITDYAFANLRPSPSLEDRIVLVNFGTLSRREVAHLLQNISQFKPRVIGMDAVYNCEGGLRDSINCPQLLDTLGNMILSRSLQEAANVVLGIKLMQTGSSSRFDTNEADSVEISDPIFSDHAQEGFISIPTDATYQEDVKISRTIYPSRIVNGKRELAFSVRMAMMYDSIKAKKFLARDKDAEIINFRGNIEVRQLRISSLKKEETSTANFGTMFFVVDAEDVLKGNVSPEFFKDKIVVIGYLGDYLGDDAWEDKFYTPLNKKLGGRANPDMFSPVVHANVVSMILNEDYVDRLSDVQELVVAFLCCFIHVLLLLKVFQKSPVWYDLTAVSLVIIQLGFYSWLRLYLFTEFNLQISLVATITSLAIASIAVVLYKELLPFLVAKIRKKQSGLQH